MITPIKLSDYLLWPDGTIQVTPDKVAEFTIRLIGSDLSKLSVTELTPEIQRFNQVSDDPITIKNGIDDNVFPPDWSLPEKYKYLNLDEYLIGLAEKIEKDELYEKRVERLAHEIWLFKERGLYDVLRVLIYAIDAMIERGAIWGVGRGSSCSSYLLFLLGLHEVDPVRYDIEITDFIR